MKRWSKTIALLVGGVFLYLPLVPLLAQQIALTVDDLPLHGPLPPQMQRRQIADNIISAFNEAKVPRVYGMVIGNNIAKTPEGKEILQDWVNAGFLLGNHTASHLNLNESSVEAWEADLQQNEAFLKQPMGENDWHWIRFPYLAEGNTAAIHQQIASFLSNHGYRVAPVTISFQDYLFNGPYVRCLSLKDVSGRSQVEAMYLEAAAASIDDSQNAARLLFGRDIPHVMLLHLGAIESIMLPRLIALLRERHFEFVTLPEATRDEAYRSATAGPGGLFLSQVATARHMREPAHSWQKQKLLETLCRNQ
jgi:peptidoglycan/xylan/chitin deacetylase (PgdA/CDA1 family)